MEAASVGVRPLCPDCGGMRLAMEGGWCLDCHADRVFAAANKEKPKKKRAPKKKRMTKWDKLYQEEQDE